MKIEGYIEISKEEFAKLPDGEGATFDDYEKDGYIYFKKVQKFPIVFEDESYNIQVCDWGIEIKNRSSSNVFNLAYEISFPLLVKAVEKAEEVMNKK